MAAEQVGYSRDQPTAPCAGPYDDRESVPGVSPGLTLRELLFHRSSSGRPMIHWTTLAILLLLGAVGHKEFFLSHAGRTVNVHEQVWNDKPTIGARREATGQTTGHQ